MFGQKIHRSQTLIEFQMQKGKKEEFHVKMRSNRRKFHGQISIDETTDFTPVIKKE